MESTETAKKEEVPDRIPLESPNTRTPLNDEPVMDILADKTMKDLKAKPAKELSANDRAVLDILHDLSPGELLRQNYIDRTFEVCPGLPVTYRTLLLRQTEAVGNDVSKYQQQREIEKGQDGVERIVWRPTEEQVRAYGTKRVMCEGVIAMGGHVLKDTPVPSRLAFFEDMDIHLLNATYRLMQKFYTAVGLLFPSDNQKELLETLKKVWAPRR